MKLIGVSGTNGSGKDSLGDLLRDQHGYMFISVTELLRIEARKRGLETERAVLSSISAEWRREKGLGVLVDQAVEMYQAEGGDSKYSGLVVSSLRNPGEVDSVHERGGVVVWTEADPKIRYERIHERGRSDDDKTYEQFLAEEAAEMDQGGDEATLHMAAVKQKADRVLLNEGSTFDELEGVIQRDLGDLL